MRQKLIRPTAALFPLVGLVGALLRSEIRDFLLEIFSFYYIIQLFGLCAAGSFRNAAATEPGVRRVDRRFGGSLPPLLLGVAVALALARLLRPAVPSVSDHAALLSEPAMFGALSAAFISLEQLLEERMFALGRRFDGEALSCVSNGLLLAGVLLESTSAGQVGRWFTGTAALGALTSVAANYLIEPVHGFSLLPRNLPFAPKACLQALLYPLVAGTALVYFPLVIANLLTHGNDPGVDGEFLFAAACFGLIPWQLARTVARRTQDESRPLNLLLIAFAALPTMLARGLPSLRPFALAGALALLCAAAVFCAPGARVYVGIALIAAANLPMLQTNWLGIALPLAAVVVNAKRALQRRFDGGARGRDMREAFPPRL